MLETDLIKKLRREIADCDLRLDTIRELEPEWFDKPEVAEKVYATYRQRGDAVSKLNRLQRL